MSFHSLLWPNIQQVFSNASRILKSAFTQCSAANAQQHRTGLTQETSHALSAIFVPGAAQSGPVPISGRCSDKQIPTISEIALHTHSAALALFAKICANSLNSTVLQKPK